jgi:hypothetical protein
MTVAVAVASVLAVLPHLVSLRSGPPVVAAALWLLALAARAGVVLLTIGWLVILVPRSEPFVTATQWCWHAVVPYVAAHLDISGHGLASAAMLIPLAAVLLSSAATVYGVVRAARAVKAYLRRFSLGAGPRGSIIVPGRDVVLAAAGIGRPQVLVSAGALLALDDDELAVGLEHERAHIRRRHRWVLLAGALARATGRPIPGSSAALRALAFHLERDADRCALRRVGDPLALASVICKAATAALPPSAAASLGGADVAERVRELVDGSTRRRRPPVSRHVRALCAVALAVAVAVPAQMGLALPPATEQARHCPA